MEQNRLVKKKRKKKKRKRKRKRNKKRKLKKANRTYGTSLREQVFAFSFELKKRWENV